MGRKKIGEYSISDQGKSLLEGMNLESEKTEEKVPEQAAAAEETNISPESGAETPAAAETTAVDGAPVSAAEPVAQQGEVAQPNSASPASLLDEMKVLGFQDLQSEEDARARLIEAYRQREMQLEDIASRYQQVSPLAQYGQQYLALKIGRAHV